MRDELGGRWCGYLLFTFKDIKTKISVDLKTLDFAGTRHDGRSEDRHNEVTREH